MTGYRLHTTHAGIETVEDLPDLDDLAERVALEQLIHELHPVNSAGYVVTFTATGPGRRVAATGHFYVRAAAVVAPAIEGRNNPS